MYCARVIIDFRGENESYWITAEVAKAAEQFVACAQSCGKSLACVRFWDMSKFSFRIC